MYKEACSTREVCLSLVYLIKVSFWRSGAGDGLQILRSLCDNKTRQNKLRKETASVV